VSEARFDDPARWWFLTRQGFEQFTNDPVAQGYEILSRHPRFPHLLTATKRKRTFAVWEHSNKHLPKTAWSELAPEARRAFLAGYKFELHRMGLLEIAWLGPKAVTVNCTEGVPSILAAVHYWLGKAGLFSRAPGHGDYSRTRGSPALLKCSIPSRGNPNMVTISWKKLIKQRRGHLLYGQSDNIVAAVRTYIEHNSEYLQHRERRLAECKRGGHAKKTSPEVIALACVAWDCQQGGVLFRDKIRPHLGAIGQRFGDPRNHLRQIRRLQSQAGFKTPSRPKTRSKKRPKAAPSVNVTGILFPGFHTEI